MVPRDRLNASEVQRWAVEAREGDGLSAREKSQGKRCFGEQAIGMYVR